MRADISDTPATLPDKSDALIAKRVHPTICIHAHFLRENPALPPYSPNKCSCQNRIDAAPK